MKTKVELILSILKFVFWVIFIGLSIQTGALLFTSVVSLYINPDWVQNLYSGLNLNELHQYSRAHYAVVVTLIVVLSGMKAHIVFMVIQLFQKINLANPFSEKVAQIIGRIGYLSVAIGLLAALTSKYCEQLSARGVQLPEMSDFVGGGTEFILLGGIIYVIAQVFHRGIELQNENQLTI